MSAGSPALQLEDGQGEDVPYLQSMLGILEILKNETVRGGNDPDVLVDYGCGAGTWPLLGSSIFRSVIGLDVLPHQLDRARKTAEKNGISNARFMNLLEIRTDSIPAVSAMIAIGVMPVVRADHAHEMFEFARDRLVVGGRFLVLAYRPIIYFDQVASLEYFSFLTVGAAVRRYAATARSALETIYNPIIQREPRARAYHARRGMIALGAQYGLRLARTPESLAEIDCFKNIDSLFSGLGHRRRTRWANWFLFEKPA